jgi:hypothetical protein
MIKLTDFNLTDHPHRKHAAKNTPVSPNSSPSHKYTKDNRDSLCKSSSEIAPTLAITE